MLVEEEWRTNIQALKRYMYYWISKDRPGLFIERLNIYEFGNEYYPVLDEDSWTAVSTVTNAARTCKHTAMINITGVMKNRYTQDVVRRMLIQQMADGGKLT